MTNAFNIIIKRFLARLTSPEQAGLATMRLEFFVKLLINPRVILQLESHFFSTGADWNKGHPRTLGNFVTYHRPNRGSSSYAQHTTGMMFASESITAHSRRVRIYRQREPNATLGPLAPFATTVFG